MDTYPELLDAQRLRGYVHGNKARASNVAIMMDSLTQQVPSLAKRGRTSTADCELVQSMTEAYDKLKSQEKSCTNMLDFLEMISSGSRDQLTQSSQSSFAQFRAKYEVKIAQRSRRYVKGFGSQSTCRRSLYLSAPHTEDWGAKIDFLLWYIK